MDISQKLRDKLGSKRMSGWSKAEIEELGLKWPPRKGWRKAIMKQLGIKHPGREPKQRIAKPKRSSSFYRTEEWKRVRYDVLRRCNGKCQLCGKSAADGIVLHVDHIKPVWKYPELALSFANLQVLCAECNWGKGGYDETDWRHQQIGDLDSQWREKVESD